MINSMKNKLLEISDYDFFKFTSSDCKLFDVDEWKFGFDNGWNFEVSKNSSADKYHVELKYDDEIIFYDVFKAENEVINAIERWEKVQRLPKFHLFNSSMIKGEDYDETVFFFAIKPLFHVYLSTFSDDSRFILIIYNDKKQILVKDAETIEEVIKDIIGAINEISRPNQD